MAAIPKTGKTRKNQIWDSKKCVSDLKNENKHISDKKKTKKNIFLAKFENDDTAFIVTPEKGNHFSNSGTNAMKLFTGL